MFKQENDPFYFIQYLWLLFVSILNKKTTHQQIINKHSNINIKNKIIKIYKSNLIYYFKSHTNEKVQSVDKIAISIGVVWLATQNPQFFGRYSKLWNVIKPEIERVINRNKTLNAIALVRRLNDLNGINPTLVNGPIAHNTFFL